MTFPTIPMVLGLGKSNLEQRDYFLMYGVISIVLGFQALLRLTRKSDIPPSKILTFGLLIIVAGTGSVAVAYEHMVVGWTMLISGALGIAVYAIGQRWREK